MCTSLRDSSALRQPRREADARLCIPAGPPQIYNQIYNTTFGAFTKGTSPPPLNYSSPVLCSAVLPVQYSTQYFYQVSDANGVYSATVYSFTSAPGAPKSVISSNTTLVMQSFELYALQEFYV